MTKRRTFLQLGLTVSVCGSLSIPALALTPHVQNMPAPDLVAGMYVGIHQMLFDQRYQNSAAHALQLRDTLLLQSSLRHSALLHSAIELQTSMPLHAITGNVTTFWYAELQPLLQQWQQWQQQQRQLHQAQIQSQLPPQALAGTTGADVLFCLERLAWDAGLRVV